MSGIIRNSLRKIVPSVRAQVPSRKFMPDHGPARENISKAVGFKHLEVNSNLIQCDLFFHF